MQDSSMHVCAKFDLCTLAYVKDMYQLSDIFDWPSYFKFTQHATLMQTESKQEVTQNDW